MDVVHMSDGGCGGDEFIPSTQAPKQEEEGLYDTLLPVVPKVSPVQLKCIAS